MPIEVNARHQRRDLPCQPDDRTRERPELGDGDEDEHLSHRPAKSERHEQKSHLLTHAREDVYLIEDNETYAREYGLSHLDVVHEVEGTDGVYGHELVLVGAGAAVEAEGYEEEGHAKELGGCILFVVVGGSLLLVLATPHEQSHPGNDEHDLQILFPRILLTHQRSHEHDWHRLAALGQNLYRIYHVSQRPHAKKCGAHARQSQHGELSGWNGRRLLGTRIPPHTGRHCIQQRGNEKER
mmetsp:Transcript_6315/g.15708  ORF Transcript_6315/g.15708 Transcript_6315/m.15708 type:complete len:240 (-) Transcript_6315:609-1328(-)